LGFSINDPISSSKKPLRQLLVHHSPLVVLLYPNAPAVSFWAPLFQNQPCWRTEAGFYLNTFLELTG
jgi:hypothetical protein